jgi:hypothetical protein
MKHITTILLLALFMFIPSLVCYAEDADSDDFERFSTYYYLNPEPQRLPTVLENFFKSEAFSDEQACCTRYTTNGSMTTPHGLEAHATIRKRRVGSRFF